MSSVTYFPELYIFCFLLLIFYTTAAAAFEHYKVHFIHESGLAIIFGIIVGIIFYFVNGGAYTLTFDEKAFFYFMLPPIIFAAGYNLKRRNFFKNFGYIFIFGIFGTIVTFIVILFLLYAVSEMDWIYIQSSPDKTRNKTVVHLTIKECLFFAATTCATDTVAALTIIKPRKYPKLFSVIFGESTLNDAVAVILFQAINIISSDRDNINIDGEAIGLLIGNFLKIGVLSVLIGLACALLCTLSLKYFHFLRISPIFEISLIFFFGYLSYVICQNIDLSGIIALLICGITMAHYAFYNISVTSKLTTGITFQTISHAVEGFLFIYIGLVCVFKDSEWSIGLIVSVFVILFIARITNVFSMSLIFSLFCKCFKLKWELDIFEMIILIVAGSIRGSVAFALIMIMSGENAALLQVTTYINLIILTIVLGGLMPHILKCVLSYRDRIYPSHAMGNLSEISELVEQDKTHSLLPHKHKTTKKGNYLNIKWRKLDDEYLKPFFIYNYTEVKGEIDVLHKLSIDEIYKVEFNNGSDFRNPLPYSIREIHDAEKRNKNNKRHTLGNQGDLDFSLEEDYKNNKSDNLINYERNPTIQDKESFKEDKDNSKKNTNEEVLNNNLIREKSGARKTLNSNKSEDKNNISHASDDNHDEKHKLI